VDIEHIRSFVAVAHTKSFRKAAELLNITQPGVSRRIKSLEDELGVTFFLRTPQSIMMTKQGKEFLPYAERVMHILQEGTEKALKEERAEKLTIAGTPTISSKLLPKVIKEFHQHYHTPIQMHTASSHEVFDMMLDQTIDFGFTSNIFPNPLLKYEKICTEKIYCVARPDFIEEYVQDGKIVRYPIPVVYTTNLKSPPWSLVYQYLTNSQYFQIVVEAQTGPIVLDLAKTGNGAAFLPYSDIAEELNNTLVTVPLPDFELPVRSVFLLSYKDKPLTDMELCFKESVYRLCREVTLPSDENRRFPPTVQATAD